MLRRVDKVLLNPTIVHLFTCDQESVSGTADQCIKIAARVDRANDEIRIVETGRGAVPIGLKNRGYSLHVLRIGINDIVFAVLRVAASAEGRVSEI